MWRSRRKSSLQIDNINTSVRKSSPNLNFIHSSLKDVEHLFSDDVTNSFNQTLAQPSPPSSTTATRRLSIFHRVHLASKFARAFSTNLSPNSTKSLPDSTYSISPEKSAKSDRPISIPDSNDTDLVENLTKLKSDRQISISDPNNDLGEKLTKSDRPISISDSNNADLGEKLTKLKSDRQISIPHSNNDSGEKLTKSDRQISIPDSNNDPGEKLTKSDRQISIPGFEKRVVLYTTSLRVVRSTFEACKTVRSILRAFRVSIDERDLSMDSRFLNELQNIMAECEHEVELEMTKLPLPRVFIGGRYIGGAEEVKQLHETGELKKVVDRLPAVTGGVCEVCGDYRFVVCEECSGSRKCYSEKGGVFRSCTLCNENGLVWCPLCLGR